MTGLQRGFRDIFRINLFLIEANNRTYILFSSIDYIGGRATKAASAKKST
jgi:hypothetical protein